MGKYPITLSFTRRINLIGVPKEHPNHGVTFQVLQEATPSNPFIYVRNEVTGELGFFEADRIKEET